LSGSLWKLPLILTRNRRPSWKSWPKKDSRNIAISPYVIADCSQRLICL
jgi:hypothetical protein